MWELRYVERVELMLKFYKISLFLFIYTHIYNYKTIELQKHRLLHLFVSKLVKWLFSKQQFIWNSVPQPHISLSKEIIFSPEIKNYYVKMKKCFLLHKSKVFSFLKTQGTYILWELDEFGKKTFVIQLVKDLSKS